MRGPDVNQGSPRAILGSSPREGRSQTSYPDTVLVDGERGSIDLSSRSEVGELIERARRAGIKSATRLVVIFVLATIAIMAVTFTFAKVLDFEAAAIALLAGLAITFAVLWWLPR